MSNTMISFVLLSRLDFNETFDICGGAWRYVAVHGALVLYCDRSFTSTSIPSIIIPVYLDRNLGR
jgi:hypothetical protein